MRFNFDLHDTKPDQSPSSAPKDDVEWIPLRNHPVFSSATGSAQDSFSSPMTRNLLAWDGASRLYFWDSDKLCLHRISVRLGDPEPTSVLAASPSKVSNHFLIFDFLVSLCLVVGKVKECKMNGM